MGVYLRTKFQVSSLILTSFRQGVILPSPSSENKPLKSPPGLVLRKSHKSWNNQHPFHPHFSQLELRVWCQAQFLASFTFFLSDSLGYLFQSTYLLFSVKDLHRLFICQNVVFYYVPATYVKFKHVPINILP